jgi:hypothetical protein
LTFTSRSVLSHPLLYLPTPFFTYLDKQLFLLVVQIPIHSCPWFAIKCSPLAASPAPRHPTDQVTYLHRRHQQHQLSRLMQVSLQYPIFKYSIFIIIISCQSSQHISRAISVQSPYIFNLHGKVFSSLPLIFPIIPYYPVSRLYLQSPYHSSLYNISPVYYICIDDSMLHIHFLFP